MKWRHNKTNNICFLSFITKYKQKICDTVHQISHLCGIFYNILLDSTYIVSKFFSKGGKIPD